jgi:hypothetical protein
MRTIRPALLCLFLVSFGAFSEELPFLKPTVSYTGLRVIESPEGEFRQRVYWTPDKVRTETEMPGMAVVNIVREDLGVMWILPEGGGMCLEQSLEENEAMSLAPGAEAYDPEDMDFRELGTETIDGRTVTKYEVLSRNEMGENRALFWVTEENIPVRMEVEPATGEATNTVFITLEELEVGPQADELFESGMECRPMPAMPQGMPGAGN